MSFERVRGVGGVGGQRIGGRGKTREAASSLHREEKKKTQTPSDSPREKDPLVPGPGPAPPPRAATAAAAARLPGVEGPKPHLEGPRGPGGAEGHAGGRPKRQVEAGTARVEDLIRW